jgi:hypothetical protein
MVKFFITDKHIMKEILQEQMLFEDYKKDTLDPERGKLSEEWNDMEIADWGKDNEKTNLGDFLCLFYQLI